MTTTHDQQILARVRAQAAFSVTTELDTVPQHLWDEVCESNRQVQLARWRDRGWTVTSTSCDKGCCTYDHFAPPGMASHADSVKCARGVEHEVLSSFNHQ